MQQLRRVAGVIAATAVISVSANAQCPDEGDYVNRRTPGSLLLYPEFDNGPGRVTVVTVTNVKCNQDDGLPDDVQVEFKYINGDNCLESNEEEDLTPCDTVTVLTNVHTGIDRGYLYVFARDPGDTSTANPAGNPITFNHLIGQVLVVDGFTSFEYSVNAVSFQGLTKEGETTDIDSPGLFAPQVGDGVRDLDGNEYTPAPDRIYIPRFLGQDPVLSSGGVHSELILIALSGGRLFQANQAIPGGGTTAFFEGWNDNEQMFSVEHTFTCWDKLRLGFLQSGNPDGMPPTPGTMAFDESTLDASFNNDPNEIRVSDGMGGFTEWRNAGWFRVFGTFASSSAETIVDPAIYAVLIESIRNFAAADLPFEYCSQENGDLIPGNILGDWNPGFDPGGAGPFFFNLDNQ